MSRSRSGESAAAALSERTTMEERRLDSLTPYWRNPRKISDEAVNAVAQSIERYGYRQPIVVDEDGTIVIGHTRYMAMRRLGRTTAEVAVAHGLTAAEIKQLRAVDNRTAEYNDWDFEKLADELAELTGQDSLDELFASLEGAPQPNVAEMDQEPAAPAVDDSEPASASSSGADRAELICPSCFHQWEQQVRAADLRKGRLEAQK